MNGLNEYPMEMNNDDVSNDRIIYSHPSFGAISVHKVSGDNLNLFESPDAKSCYMIDINNAHLHTGCGRSSVFSRNSIVRATFSDAQFMELFTVNGSVVPCTLEFTEESSHIERPDLNQSENDPFSIDVDGLDNFVKTVKYYQSEIEKILSAKGQMSKADKDKVSDLFANFKTFLKNNAPAIRERSIEEINKVQSRTNNIIQQYVDKKVSNILSGNDVPPEDSTKKLT